jgi:hypothetical protein
LEAIVAPNGSGLIRKARSIERRVEKIPRTVSRENTPRAIPAMCSRRKSQNQQLCAWVAKPRHRLAPVRPIAKGAPFLSRHFFAVLDQARALPASHDLFVQRT